MFVCVYVRSYLRNPLTDLPQILTKDLGRKTLFPSKTGFPS